MGVEPRELDLLGVRHRFQESAAGAGDGAPTLEWREDDGVAEGVLDLRPVGRGRPRQTLTTVWDLSRWCGAYRQSAPAMAPDGAVPPSSMPTRDTTTTTCVNGSAAAASPLGKPARASTPRPGSADNFLAFAGIAAIRICSGRLTTGRAAR